MNLGAFSVSLDVKNIEESRTFYETLGFEVIDGQYKGRKLWDRLVLQHPNSETVRIARGTLSAICRAVKVMTPKDSVELHNLPLIISVGIDKRRAATGRRRISEATLLGLTWATGLAGGWLGMMVFRHKTRKLLFKLKMVLVTVLNLLWLVAYGYYSL